MFLDRVLPVPSIRYRYLWRVNAVALIELSADDIQNGVIYVEEVGGRIHFSSAFPAATRLTCFMMDCNGDSSFNAVVHRG